MIRPILVAAALAAFPVALLARHNRLAKSVPGAAATVASPRSVRLWFTEKVNPKLSSIIVTAEAGTKAETGAVRGTDDPRSIAVEVTKPLATGKYSVAWRTAGDDGHSVRGTYTFTVQ